MSVSEVAQQPPHLGDIGQHRAVRRIDADLEVVIIATHHPAAGAQGRVPGEIGDLGERAHAASLTQQPARPPELSTGMDQ
ncbi:hypothetical protein GCM10027020_18520 [Nocardioides salsibiostraticola]